MDSVSVRTAQDDLPNLVRRAAAGEEIVISEDGQPKARLVPLAAMPSARRIPGDLEGKIKIEPEFYLDDVEIESVFE